MLDSLSQELTSIAWIPNGKKAVMWNSSKGAEHKVERETNVAKVRNILT